MKILHIMASSAQGGAETYSTDVMLSLHREGVDQCVVMAKTAPRYQELEKAGLRMAPHVLSSRFRPLQKFRLARLIKRENPDVVHSWMRRAASLLSPRLNKHKPVIGWFGGYSRRAIILSA
jgi:hypothetical protein